MQLVDCLARVTHFAQGQDGLARVRPMDGTVGRGEDLELQRQLLGARQVLELDAVPIEAQVDFRCLLAEHRLRVLVIELDDLDPSNSFPFPDMGDLHREADPFAISGQLQLIPDDAAVAALRADYREMIKAGMFIGDARQFDDIARRLERLRAQINQPDRAA